MMKSFLLTVFLSTLLASYAQCSRQAPNSKTSDLTWYIKALQRELETAKTQLHKINDEKGYDPEAVRLMNESKTAMRAIEDKLQVLQTQKMPSSGALINMSIIKERRGLLKDNLVALGALVPKGPPTFPARCVIYKADSSERGPELAKKEGLEMRIGRLEPKGISNTLVLSTSDPNNPGTLVDYPLDDKIGLIGSVDPNAPTIAKQPTPPNMHVTGWVNLETKKVMCLTHPVASAALVPKGAENFPTRCVIYKADSSSPERGEALAKKEGLEMKIGKVEARGMFNTMVLSTPDPTHPEIFIDHHLDDKIGLIGSVDPKAPTIARQPTPANMSVTGWVNRETNKVVCVTQPIQKNQP